MKTETIWRRPWSCTLPDNLVSRRRHPDGRTLDILRDPFPPNPREEQDNLTTMVCFHKRYSLGDKHSYVCDNYTGWEGLRDDLERDFGPGAFILPVFLYDHSGLTMSTVPFSCPWDSSQVGYIAASAKATAAEGVADPLLVLRQEIEVYDQWLRGEIYGFQLYGLDGEEADSCWGFYGDSDKSGMAEHVDGFAKFEEQSN